MNASSAVQAKDVVTCAAAEARLYDRQFQAEADDKFQFERHGYFVADRKDHAPGKPVFNRVTGLKDSWAK